LKTFLKLRTMKNNKTIKRLSLKYKYLTLELQEVQEEFSVFRRQFSEYIVTLEQTHNIHIFDRQTTIQKKSCEKVKKNQNKRDSDDDTIKQMYKQVAQLTHPDKTQDDLEKSAMFRQAKRAVDSNDLMGMLCLCDDLELETPQLTKQHQQTIEDNIKQIELKIKSIKSQDAYAWGVAEQAARDNMEQAILSKFNST
jgi:hypothetical protein